MKTNELSKIRHNLIVIMPYSLLHFLIEKKALKQYVANRTKRVAFTGVSSIYDHSGFFKDHAPHNYIIAAFTWKTTIEGYEYWDDLHTRWEQIVNNNCF